LLLVLWLVLAPAAHAQTAGDDVIDISGCRERPRGETAVAWTRPAGLQRETGLRFGRALRQEIFTPVSRVGMARRMAVIRAVSPH